MPDRIIGSVLARQFACILHSLRDALSHLDDQQWRTGEIEFLVPARQTYHLLELADFFVSDGPDRFKWNPLGIPDVASFPDQFPSQDKMLAYLALVEERVAAWLTSRSDPDLLGPNPVFHWTGPTLLDHAVYSLRHAQHHVGLLNSELRRRGLPRGEWR